MQVGIVNGIYTDTGNEIRTSYPVNLVPVPQKSGISNGFLRPAEGLVSQGNGLGVVRGGVNWNGVCYRVMGTKLVSIDSAGVITELGDVGGTNKVTFDYSFDRLAIVSNENLFYWDGSALTQVTDTDLGVVLDMIWIDGFFMTTDGEFLVVTELLDPYAVNPFKYGSSEVDPDPVVALLKVRNEAYALNRYTIEVFSNVGGDLFPFQRIAGAQIMKGVVGTFACCVFMDAVAFVGSGRDEAPAVYVGANSMAIKLSTQEIDLILKDFTEVQLSDIKLEVRNDRDHTHLYIHLPDRTLVYDGTGSKALGEPIWYTLTSSMIGYTQYRARDFVWVYDKWSCGDPTSDLYGYLDDNIGSHYGDDVRWEFGTHIVYNEGNGALFRELELVSLTGRVALGVNPTITTSYSTDGVNWSQRRSISVGTKANWNKRLVWLQQGFMRNWRIQKFEGDTQAHLSFARLEAQLDPLAY